MKERFGISAACVAGGALYKGVAKYVGMDIINAKGATGDAKTDLKAKAKAAIEACKSHDFVFLHVKAVDSFSHDGNFKAKVKMLEKIDKELVGELRKAADKNGIYVIITGDHSTPCIRKAHSGHEVPIVIYGKNERKDSVKKFDEMSCMAGGMGHLKGSDLMKIMLNLIEKGKMYGS
jgi:2,3-bisphosphoglycerate-independent phosphoglycerate mutase